MIVNNHMSVSSRSAFGGSASTGFGAGVPVSVPPGAPTTGFGQMPLATGNAAARTTRFGELPPTGTLDRRSGFGQMPLATSTGQRTRFGEMPPTGTSDRRSGFGQMPSITGSGMARTTGFGQLPSTAGVDESPLLENRCSVASPSIDDDEEEDDYRENLLRARRNLQAIDALLERVERAPTKGDGTLEDLTSAFARYQNAIVATFRAYGYVVDWDQADLHALFVMNPFFQGIETNFVPYVPRDRRAPE